MSLKRLALTIAFLLAVGAGVSAVLRHEGPRPRTVEPAQTIQVVPQPLPTRAWRWPTQFEWVVHEIGRHMTSWALLANGQNPKGSRIQVRREEGGDQPGSFQVELTTAQGPRKLRVRSGTHVWDPAAYVDLARTLLGAGAVLETGGPAAGLDELLLASDTVSLRKADALLFQTLSRRPRDPALHEQAALLWAAHALRESEGQNDARPFLNGLSAHLALARALRGNEGPGPEGEIAAAVLDTLLHRQVEAIASVERMRAAAPRQATAAWLSAIRLRITHDPRLVPKRTDSSRLEKLEGLRAIVESRGCRPAVQQARAWTLPPAADWVASTVRTCNDPERTELSSLHFDLQVQDAAQLVDLAPGSLESILGPLQAASGANTHQPGLPTSVVSAYVRADAGFRRIVASFTRILTLLKHLGRPDEAKALALSTESVREKLPQRAELELSLDKASDRDFYGKPTVQTCEHLARLLIDRPDLLGEGWWSSVQDCQGQEALRIGRPSDYGKLTVIPGTARLGTGPWLAGVDLKDGLAEAVRRAPWDTALIGYDLLRTYRGEVPAKVLRQAYEKLLEYDMTAMASVASGLHDPSDDDEVQRLAERLCEVDVEKCAGYAEYLATLGRDAAAEKMWKRALADAQDQIALSNSVGRYVNLLLDRGQTEDALRIAHRAADVYSGTGLFTLAFAFERLGRFDDAAREYAKITQRYGTKDKENVFYVRYGQRHGGERFARERQLALAELFPKGLVRQTVEGFRLHNHQGGVMGHIMGQPWDERLRRLGIHDDDFITAIDGFVVENQKQMDAVLTFTDDPKITVIVMRQRGEDKGWRELSGQYRRWKYGPVRPTS